MSHEFTKLQVTVEFDADSATNGWDGDYALDPEKSWTPYLLIFEGYCASRDDWTVIDSIGAVWLSDDNDGRDYLETCVSDYFTVPKGFTRDDIDIQSPV